MCSLITQIKVNGDLYVKNVRSLSDKLVLLFCNMASLSTCGVRAYINYLKSKKLRQK